MDYSKGLEVCIGNYGYYNEGQLRDAWITLPKSEQEIHDFLQEHGLQDPMHEEIYISDYDGYPLGANKLFDEYAHLGDLNLLAMQLMCTDSYDLEKVEAWIAHENEPDDIVELMNMIEDADSIDLYGYEEQYATCTPEENYGHTVVEYDEDLKSVLENNSLADSAFDYEAYGRDCAMQAGVTLLEDGYLPNQNGPDLYTYDRDELKEMIVAAYEKKFGPLEQDAEKDAGHELGASLDDNVKAWYLKEHPSSFLGQAIREDMTFNHLASLTLVMDADFAIGVNEEGIRTEILDKLAELQEAEKEQGPSHEDNEAETKRESASEREARVTEQAHNWNDSHDSRSKNEGHDDPEISE